MQNVPGAKRPQHHGFSGDCVLALTAAIQPEILFEIEDRLEQHASGFTDRTRTKPKNRKMKTKPKNLKRAVLAALAISALNFAPGLLAQTNPQEQWNEEYRSDFEVPRGNYTGRSPYMSSKPMAKTAPAPKPAPAPAPAPKPAPAPAPAPALKTSCNDATWGLIRMTKTMPAEVALGGEFKSELNYTAQACAANVVVRDTIPANATYVRSEPAATVDGNQLVWKIGNLDAGESRNIQLWLKADKEGTIVNCASVSADPRTCAITRVVNPAIQLTKSEPKDVTVCDPIPVSLVVKNSGSSQLTGVKVSDSLPSGLTSDGKSSVVFNSGNLAPGESKEFKFNATAAGPGNYVNSAEVTSDQGVSAKASASTAVHQAVLAISCKARDQQYIGRPFDICYTVSNSGDAASTGTQVTVPVPAGLVLKSATAGGHMSGNNLVWDLGSLAAKSPQELCATFTSASAGTFSFNATAKGACAKPVSSACETKIVGISALLLEKGDNPDPIQVGEETTYYVRVTNQGTSDDTQVKVVVEFDKELTPVSADNGGIVSGQKVTFPAYPRLAPKAAFEYHIKAKGVSAGDSRVKFIRTSTDIPDPTTAEESTRVY